MAEAEGKIGIANIQEALDVIEGYRVAIVGMLVEKGVNTSTESIVTPQNERLVEMLDNLGFVEDILGLATGNESSYLNLLKENMAKAGSAEKVVQKGLNLLLADNPNLGGVGSYKDQREHPNF